jgi:hypothetical protein
MHLGRAQRSAATAPGGLCILATGNPMPQPPPVFHHLRQVELAAASPSTRPGPLTDGSVPISAALEVDHRPGRGGPVQVIRNDWRHGR